MSENSSTTAPAPIFLFGFDRSGTTLLAMMVGAHAEIAVPFSCTGMWYRYGAALERYNHLASQADLERMVDDLLAEERIGLWDVELDRDALLDGLGTGDYAAVVDRFHGAYAAAKGKHIWANTDGGTLEGMDRANAWFPTAKFIHIVRDGRDVALSHGTMRYSAGNIVDCAHGWRNKLHTSMKMGAILGEDRYLVVRYEDLVLDSEATLRRMCAFMGVEYSSQMLDYHTMVDAKVPEDKMWLWPALNKPPVKSKVDRWRREMGDTTRLAFERVANDMLKKLDYEAFDAMPRSLAVLGLELWYFLGSGGRFTRLKHKLGLSEKSKLERDWERRKKPAKTSRQGYAEVQKQAFSQVIEDGGYSLDFQHGGPAQDFFVERMSAVVAPREGALSILECGCGTGTWLDVFRRRCADDPGRDYSYHGFDITPDMVDIARQKMAEHAPGGNFAAGDIADGAAYGLGGRGGKFDVIFAYDVVQQLPRKLQYEACRTMVEHLAEGGVLVIFDHDSRSKYGRVMGRKKFLTQYLKLGLVPEYYCNAKYPPLGEFAIELAADGYLTEIAKSPKTPKRALIVRRAGGG